MLTVFEKKIQHPGRSQGEARSDPVSGKTNLELGWPICTAAGHFRPLGSKHLGPPLIPSGFAAKESSLKRMFFSSTPPLWCFGSAEGSNLSLCSTDFRFPQTAGRISSNRTSHTFHKSWLYAPFQRIHYGGLEPLLPRTSGLFQIHRHL